MNPAALCGILQAEGIPTCLCDQVGSTQDVAMSLVRDGAVPGTVVLARRQESGRGRSGRRWLSPVGGLYSTIILKPEIDPAMWPGATVHAGAAVVRALRGHGIMADLKWPNDCLVGGRKLCGMLAESSPSEGWMLVGLGMNVDWDDCLRDTGSMEGGFEATALSNLVSGPCEQLCASVIRDVRYALIRASEGCHVDSDGVSALLWTSGAVSVDCGAFRVSGTVAGVDEAGRLVLVGEDGALRAVSCGEVIHARGD